MFIALSSCHYKAILFFPHFFSYLFALANAFLEHSNSWSIAFLHTRENSCSCVVKLFHKLTIKLAALPTMGILNCSEHYYTKYTAVYNWKFPCLIYFKKIINAKPEYWTSLKQWYMEPFITLFLLDIEKRLYYAKANSA